MGEAECPPAEGNDAWLVSCAILPAAVPLCIMAAKSCAAMRACMEAR